MDIDLHFPFAGLDRSGPVGRPPNRPVDGTYARTAYTAQNCRGWDASGRLRGGQRPGLAKYVSTRPATAISQDLRMLVATGITDPGGGTVQGSQSGRWVGLVHACEGNVYTCPSGGATWTVATNAASNTPPLNSTGLVRGAANNQKMYFADGTNKVVYDPLTNTASDWVLTDGTYPVDSDGNTPRLICTWRGRTVLSGLLKDPSVIFMSAVSDPENFDYFPALPVPPDAAWSGHTGPQGLTGDVITALIPYTDDQLIVGMDSGIAIFRGDPNAGGQLDNVTTSVGMAWGEAWCMDPRGVVYFFSNRCGIYSFVPGSLPQRMSTPIDSLLKDVNTGEYGIRLLWNDRYQGFHVYVTLLASAFTAQHYFWEARSNAWWADTYTNTSHNPLCCCTFDGNDADDRVALIGSWDGYVRSVSSTADDDDGTDIESEVWIGPFLTKFNDAVMLEEVQGVMGADSADVNYAVFVADTAEEALDSTAAVDGTWSAGRNYTDKVMRAGYAAYVRLTATGAWAMEQIRAVVGDRGLVRRRGK